MNRNGGVVIRGERKKGGGRRDWQERRGCQDVKIKQRLFFTDLD